MSILSFFIRFTVAYTLLMAAVGIAAGVFEIENASHFNTPVLFAISFWCFYSYSDKNERIIEGSEKWKLIFSALAGDTLGSALLVTPTVILGEIPLEYLLIGMAIAIPLHFLILLAVSHFAKKQVLKLKPELAGS
jgi:hypothetical protein